MSITAVPEHLDRRPSKRVTVMAAVTAVVLCFYARSGETGAVYAAAILAISLVFDVFLLRDAKGEDKLANSLSLCEFFKVVLLGIYCLHPGKAWSIASGYGAMVLAILLAYGVTKTVWDVVQPAEILNKLPPDDLVRALRHNQLRSLCWVMAAFLHTAYFLSFAFALSDQHKPHDLYVSNAHSGEPSQPSDHKGYTREGSHCRAEDIDRVKKIFSFESSGTLPPCTRSVDLALGAPSPTREKFCKARTLSDRMRMIGEILRRSPECSDEDAAVAEKKKKIATWNAGEIEELRELFMDLAADDASQKFLVEIRGHANLTPFVDPVKTKTSPAYQSNYELSRRRAEAVAVLVQGLQKVAFSGKIAPRMEPSIYGVSNEDDFLDADGEWPDGKYNFDRFLSTEVRVIPIADTKLEQQLQGISQEPRSLALIDYLYFTFYTITTTGYGDIIPVSSFAKLAVTIANLLEVLFVYVIINVVSTATAKAKEGIQ